MKKKITDYEKRAPQFINNGLRHFIMLLLFFFILLPHKIRAQTIVCTEFLCDPHETLCGILCQVIPQLPAFVIGGGIVVAIVFLVVSGINFITAGDDQKKITQARGTFTGALIGLVILILAYAVIRLVALFVGVDPSEIFVIREVANCKCN